MGVLIRSNKNLRSLSTSHPSISSLLSPPSDSIPPLHHLPPAILSAGSLPSRYGGGKVGSFLSSLSIPSTGSSYFSSESDGLFRTVRGCFRCYSSVSAAAASDASYTENPRGLLQEIVQLARNEDDELESKLDAMHFSLDVKSVKNILGALNDSKVPAFRFFDWIGARHPDLATNSSICNLVIDNCGRCDDHEKMGSLLANFNQKNVFLTKDAFGFLAVKEGDEWASMEAVKKLVGLLSNVGGGVYLTGVQSLVRTLASSVSFEMAKLTISLSDRRVSYHSILIREMCKQLEFRAARDEIDLMREEHGDACNLDCRHIYNFMISTMLKAGEEDAAKEVLQEMKTKGFPPDALTFEIQICDSVAKGRFSTTIELFDLMVEEAGLVPRISTHATLLKMFFDLQQYEKTYSYVLAATERFKCSGHRTYNVLVELHRKKGHLVTSKNILCEMMSKGLAPDSFVYRTVLRNLKVSRWEQEAVDLENQYEKLRSAA